MMNDDRLTFRSGSKSKSSIPTSSKSTKSATHDSADQHDSVDQFAFDCILDHGPRGYLVAWSYAQGRHHRPTWEKAINIDSAEIAKYTAMREYQAQQVEMLAPEAAVKVGSFHSQVRTALLSSYEDRALATDKTPAGAGSTMTSTFDHHEAEKKVAPGAVAKDSTKAQQRGDGVVKPPGRDANGSHEMEQHDVIVVKQPGADTSGSDEGEQHAAVEAEQPDTE
jgi:hypothetical protein